MTSAMDQQMAAGLDGPWLELHGQPVTWHHGDSDYEITAYVEIQQRADDESEWAEGVSARGSIMLRLSDVPAAAIRDTVTIDAEVWIVGRRHSAGGGLVEFDLWQGEDSQHIAHDVEA